MKESCPLLNRISYTAISAAAMLISHSRRFFVPGVSDWENKDDFSAEDKR